MPLVTHQCKSLPFSKYILLCIYINTSFLLSRGHSCVGTSATEVIQKQMPGPDVITSFPSFLWLAIFIFRGILESGNIYIWQALLIMQMTAANYWSITIRPAEFQEILLDKVCVKYFFGVLPSILNVFRLITNILVVFA